MFSLTREVRFALNTARDRQMESPPTNSYGGHPSLTGTGQFLTLQVTLAGNLDLRNGYLRNIKEIDAAVRQHVVQPMTETPQPDIFNLPRRSMLVLQSALAGAAVSSVRLALTPFLSVSCHASEIPMVRLSQKFEFSASHRLHNPTLSDEENRKSFGKCNNPHGHGHNYEVQVTLRGQPDAHGLLIDVPAFERIVATTVIDRFDHKNLNLELPEFRELIPSVENIAMVIYRLLKPEFKDAKGKLASVTVWETPKTWCEYAE